MTCFLVKFPFIFNCLSWGWHQFLPQDRVCEFAKLTPVQLLEETEKAVGDPRLPVMHSSLITKSEELKRLERVSSFLTSFSYVGFI